MSNIGVGVIGYGYWGPNLVRNFAEVQDARVVAVSDQRPERLGMRRAPIPGRQDSEPTLAISCAIPAVDAVVIATPVSTATSSSPRPRCGPASTCWSRSR